MRVLIVLPRQDRATGNEVTAERHRAGLAALGHEVALVRLGLDDAPLLRAAVQSFAPDVVHLLHAYRSGTPWLAADMTGVPCVVTLTGTDIHGGIDRPMEGAVIRRVLAGAGRIITQNRLTAARLHDDFPRLAAKVAYLPPGILLGTDPPALTRAELAAPGACLFFHPAGLRPVKGNSELLDLFDPLAAAGLSFEVAFCGPALDPDYSAAFLSALAQRPWARYLGVIPPAAMAATLRQADVVLNNSQSEGLPNALLEAAALGVPILARAIPGNAAVVEEGINGLLFDDPPSFDRQARALIVDPGLRRRLSRPARECYRPETETQLLAALYVEVIA